MASESKGAKGQPYFSSSGAPAIDVDPGLVADFAALVGNHIVGTTAQRNANVVPGTSVAVWNGLLWSDTDDGFTYKRAGGSWVLLTIMAAGTATVAATGVTTITFPAGRFSVAPIVQVTVISTAGTVSIAWLGSAPTSTTVGVRIFTLGGTQIAGVVHWTAVQMTPTSAAG